MFFFFSFGFRTRFKIIGQGVFFCPRCGGDRPYLLRVGRRWFTLYYIPIFPTGAPSNEHVLCGVCNQAFNTTVLKRLTAGQLLARLLDAVRGAAVHVLRTGSIGVPAARACAVAEVQKAGMPAYDDAALTADLDAVPGDLSALYVDLAKALNMAAKEKLVQGTVRIAAADGALTDMELTVVKHLGSSLELTPVHVEGICAQAGQPAGR